jgi:hypothetical protein
MYGKIGMRPDTGKLSWSSKQRSAKEFKCRLGNYTLVHHKKYLDITVVHLEERLRRSTKHLKKWLEQIDHQRRATDILNTIQDNGQMSIKQEIESMAH